jgi:hypothetical protein
VNSSTLRWLGFIVALLVIALVLVDLREDGELPESGKRLFPDMEAVLNEVGQLTISRAGEEPVVINRQDGTWGVAARNDYPARFTSVREVLLAMAEARVVEPKTANPELHDRLGVQDPAVAGSKGVRVTATAGEQSFSLIFGNASQDSYRYARIAGEDQSWLIDQNPDIPATIGKWLQADIVDIGSDRVRSVTIRHPDGEVISVSKATEADTDFAVADIPTGRELSYSTVANGLAGALNDLDLDDVRPAVATDADAITTEFETFDGLRIVTTTVRADDVNWVSLIAEASGDDSEEASAITAHVEGWQFRIADYKANLLTRRWEDILKPPAAESE